MEPKPEYISVAGVDVVAYGDTYYSCLRDAERGGYEKGEYTVYRLIQEEQG